jgi:hypothetical protein
MKNMQYDYSIILIENNLEESLLGNRKSGWRKEWEKDGWV